MGSTINLEPFRNAKDNLHRQRLGLWVNPSCNLSLVSSTSSIVQNSIKQYKTAVIVEEVRRTVETAAERSVFVL